jgi:acyl-CoA hydrolase
MKEKSPDFSKIETRYLVMPEHTNHYGTVFGGVILSWIDIAAAMVAERHCAHEAVTVSIDKVVFLSPIYIGDHVLLQARINYTGNTSMEIEVNVFKESPSTGLRIKTTSSFLTFVGLNKQKKPAKIPQLLLENDEDKKIFVEAKIRAERRKSC